MYLFELWYSNSMCTNCVCVFHFPHNPRHLSPCQLLYSGTCLLHTPFVNFAFVLLSSEHWSSHSSWEDSQAPSRTREWLTILGRKLSTRCCSKGEVATFRPPSRYVKSSRLWHASAPLVSWVGSAGSLLRLAAVRYNATLQTRLRLFCVEEVPVPALLWNEVEKFTRYYTR